MKRITFAWDANPEADLKEYRLYQSDALGIDGVLIGIVPAGTEMLARDVEDGTYWFYLTAIDVNGNESGKSEEVKAVCEDAPLLAPPTGFHIVNIVDINGGIPGDNPVITSVAGAIIHGEVITIKGSGFGTKNPVAPLIWDDGEGKTLNDIRAPKLECGWTEADVHNANNPEFEWQYRADGWRGVGAVHQYSRAHLAAGHQYTGVEGNPSNTAVLGMNGPYSHRWFGMWYVRYDPLWPKPCQLGENHKNAGLYYGPNAYDGAGFYTQYVLPYVGAECGRVCDNVNRAAVKIVGGSSHRTWHHDWGDGMANNPGNQWVHEEMQYANDMGLFKFLGDNMIAAGWNNPESINAISNMIGIFVIGGYYRKTLGSGGADPTDDNAYRHIDDAYIDNTLSRIILANAPVYEDATVIEPQIPSAWNDSSIICAVNLGRLIGNTAYLFIFDADNNHNEQGFPVTIE